MSGLLLTLSYVRPINMNLNVWGNPMLVSPYPRCEWCNADDPAGADAISNQLGFQALR
jgi:hypothetical protein